MDDYLTKPFSREQLAATLLRWLPKSGAAQAGAAPPTLPASAAPAEAPAEDPIDWRALDAIRHLPGPNGSVLVNKVIRAYLADTPPRLAQMRAAADAGDAEALRKAAHGLKSSSANVGAQNLAALCKELETIGRGGSVDAAAPLAGRCRSGVHARRRRAGGTDCRESGKCARLSGPPCRLC